MTCISSRFVFSLCLQILKGEGHLKYCSRVDLELLNNFHSQVWLSAACALSKEIGSKWITYYIACSQSWLICKLQQI